MYTKTVYFISQISTLKMGFRAVYFITPVYFISTVYFISPPPVGFFEIFGEKSFFEKKFFSIFLCWGCVRVFPNLLPLPVFRKKCQGKSLRKN